MPRAASEQTPDLPMTIPAVLDRAAALFGDREGLVEPERRLTFAELAAEVDVAARALVASGVERGDRVAVWGPNIGEWVVAALAVHRVGGVLVTLNTRFKGAEAGHVLRTAGASMLFAVTDFLGTDYVALLDGVDGLSLRETIAMRGPARGGATAWAEFLARASSTDPAVTAARAAAVVPADPCDILFTSGTTGAPKGAVLAHGASVRAYDAWSSVVGLRPGDRYLVVNPFFHSFGLKAGILASLVKGATIVPQLTFDVPEVMRRIPEERITMLPGPPTIYQTILNAPDLAEHDLSSLRLAVTGAAAIPVELIRRMRDELGFETVVTGYGLTEATGIATMCRHTDDAETIATTSGRAIPGVEVVVADEAGSPRPAGEPGEVLVRGYNVMLGYHGDAEATEKAIDADGWLHTGDIGVLDAAGNLRITDRLKDMFIVGGFNAYPAEIENTISAHPAVAQVAVVGVPDERMGEVGMAFVIPRTGAEVDPAELISWCRERMANYKVPRRVEVVESLPTNAGGKVLKYELRARA